MLVFVIDHGLTTYLPFTYSKYRQKRVCTLSVIAWFLELEIAIVMLPGLLDYYAYSPPDNDSGMGLYIASEANCQFLSFCTF